MQAVVWRGDRKLTIGLVEDACMDVCGYRTSCLMTNPGSAGAVSGDQRSDGYIKIVLNPGK